MGNGLVLAFDIGGANLKAADGCGFAAHLPFPLWRQPRQLPEALRQLLEIAPPARRIVATMTGELADCFRTKADGVVAIVEALVCAAGDKPVEVYLTDGSLVPSEDAIRRPLEAAASNWHVLARFAARYLPGGSGLLIDIGSTTCDLIPLFKGEPVACGKTDPQRLASGELVYTGIGRSPVCAVVSVLPWRGTNCPVAQELFATTLDAYLTLGDLPEDPENTQTADGRPATREFAHERLARMICADRAMFTESDARAAAKTICDAQTSRIATSVQRVRKRIAGSQPAVVISGEGEFLARRVLQHIDFAGNIVSLGDQLGPRISQVAPAHALAVLTAELESNRAADGDPAVGPEACEQPEG